MTSALTCPRAAAGKLGVPPLTLSPELTDCHSERSEESTSDGVMPHALAQPFLATCPQVSQATLPSVKICVNLWFLV